MRVPCIAACLCCLALLAAPPPVPAQGPPDAPIEMAEPLPPPDIAEPGVEVEPAEVEPEELPEKVQAPPGAPPEVTIRTDAETGDVIEEYRAAGRVYMVRVRPPVGPEYMLLDTNGDGLLDTYDYEAPVRPVYWTIYEWE